MQHRTVDLHGHTLSYRMAGKGPSILLIHGMAGSEATWEPIIPALAENFTVLAPDLPGHGASDKPEGDYSLGAFASILRDLLDALNLRSATLVGQSLGGGIAMQFSYQYPERTDRLVLVGSGGLGGEVSPLLRLLALPGSEYVLPLIFPSFVRTAGDHVTELLHGLGMRAPFAEEVWRSYAGLTDAQTRRAFIRTLRAVIDLHGQSVSALDKLHLAYGMPALIVWGENDTIIPVAHAHVAHDALPGSRLEIFEGCNHFPHTEEPEHFVEVLTSFMNETVPTTRELRARARLRAAHAD
ncbi:MAG: alpha/beta fold hydrolase [Acidimicrobiia bacterium]|nr:alpha/beta fold hydrolase [Acidimicrobiia bacterium]